MAQSIIRQYPIHFFVIYIILCFIYILSLFSFYKFNNLESDIDKNMIYSLSESRYSSDSFLFSNDNKIFTGLNSLTADQPLTIEDRASNISKYTSAMQAQASMVNTLFVTIGILITGIGITSSSIISSYETKQASKLHDENYRKNYLEAFHKDRDVKNFKNILEAICRNSTMLPYINLDIFTETEFQKEKENNTCEYTGNPLFHNFDQNGPVTILKKKLDSEFEIFPSIQNIVNGLTPRGSNQITIDNINNGTALSGFASTIHYNLLEAKLTRSFDSFLEYYTIIGKLMIEHIKQKNINSIDSENSDIEIWWDSIDMPYWSQLIIFGGDIEEDKEDNTENFNFESATKSGKEIKNPEEVRQYLKDKDIDSLKIKVGDAKLSIRSNDYKHIIRQRMRYYISEYYPEVLGIALVLATYETELTEIKINKLISVKHSESTTTGSDTMTDTSTQQEVAEDDKPEHITTETGTS